MTASDTFPRSVVTTCVEMNPLLGLKCEHFGFSTQAAFLEVRKCYLRLLFLLDLKNVLFLST